MSGQCAGKRCLGGSAAHALRFEPQYVSAQRQQVGQLEQTLELRAQNIRLDHGYFLCLGVWASPPAGHPGAAIWRERMPGP